MNKQQTIEELSDWIYVANEYTVTYWRLIRVRDRIKHKFNRNHIIKYKG